MDTKDSVDFSEVAANDEIENFLADLDSGSETENSEAQLRGGSRARQSAKFDCGHERFAVEFYKDYFSKDPTYPEHMLICSCKVNKFSTP